MIWLSNAPLVHGTDSWPFHHPTRARNSRGFFRRDERRNEFKLDPSPSGNLDGPVMEFPFDGGVGADGNRAGEDMALDGPPDDCMTGLQSAMNRGAFEDLHRSPGDLAVNPAADDDVALRGQAARDGQSGLQDRTRIGRFRHVASIGGLSRTKGLNGRRASVQDEPADMDFQRTSFSQ